MLTEGWYREHTPHFKAALEDGEIIDMPADRDIQEDHRAFVLVKGVARIPEAGKSNTDKNRHGDSGIAHLLCDFASCNPEAPIEFMSISINLDSDEFGDDLESLLSDFKYM
jgi:phage FluMu gp28-like protein